MLYIVLRHTDSTESDFIHGIFEDKEQAMKYIEQFMTPAEQHGTLVLPITPNQWITNSQFRSVKRDKDAVVFRDRMTEEAVQSLTRSQRQSKRSNQARRERKPSYMVRYTDINDFMDSEPEKPEFVSEYNASIASKNTWLLSQYNQELLQKNG